MPPIPPDTNAMRVATGAASGDPAAEEEEAPVPQRAVDAPEDALARRHVEVDHHVPAEDDVEAPQGLEGVGIATSYTPIEAAVAAFRSGIADLVVGMDPLAPEQVYQKLFALTWSRLASEKKWAREAIVRISSAVDIACWDLVGKVAKLPLYRLFGGYRSEVPCYVTCAYYRDGKTMSELRDEMQMLKAQGHQGFKAKAGGVPLREDI